MTGPRRPPAARAGTVTAQPRVGAGSTRPSGSLAGSRQTSNRRATGEAKASGRRSDAASAKASGRANRRAISRVDGPRGRRDGAGEEARKRKVRRRARVTAGLAVTVLLVGVLFVAVLPTSTFLDQRSDTSRLEAELAEIEAERATIAAEIERFGTDSEIEAQARRNGYVRPGEEAYNVLPTPIDPIGLPEVWPFTGVEEAMGVR